MLSLRKCFPGVLFSVKTRLFGAGPGAMLGSTVGGAELLREGEPFSGEGAASSEPSVTLLHRMNCVDRAAKYVDEHLARPLTLDELASAAGMSKFHLHRAIVSLTGQTPAQLVAASRLRSAMVRLAAAGRSAPRVLDVALEVGFQDASAFSRSFRGYYGLTPTEVQAGARPASPWLLPAPLSSASSRGRSEPERARHLARAEPGPWVRIEELAPFYCYGQEAVGEQDRTFAGQAPQAFSVTFDVVERHGVEECLGPMAVPSGGPWAKSSERRLLCAFRSSVRLALSEQLSERHMPGGRYLVERHVGPYESRWQAWSRLSTLRRLLLGATAKGGEGGRRPFEVERGEAHSSQPAADIYFPL